MRKIALKMIILIFIFSTASIYGQASDWYVDKPIREIRFSGLINIDESELTGITEQFIDKNFTDTLFWDLQSKLYSLNFFDSFTANAVPFGGSYESVIIEFTVTEHPLIRSIVLKGNKSISKSDILDEIVLKTDDILNKARIRMDESAIKDLYIEEGYPDVTVAGSFNETDENGYVDLIFTITEGSQTRIKTISFSGNTFASENTLKGQIESSQQSFFNKGIYQESLIEKDKEAIRKYYYDSGYIDMKILNVETIPIENEDENDEKNYLQLIFYIEEGKQWFFGGFEFEGNTLFTDEELYGVLTLQPGSILNKSRLESDFMKISDIYYNDGYIYNTINRVETKNEETNEISFKIVITEKNRAHIENIIISGNEKTKDHVILREIPLEVGDVFSKSAIMQGLNNLYNTRYFSSVVPEMPYGSELGLMDLVLNVEEQNTTDIQFGVTFSAATGSIPIIGFLKWNDSNFLGEGTKFSIGTEVSTTKQEFSISYKDNWLFERRISGGLDFSISHNKNKDVPQDIMFPIFNEDDENVQVVPDPYDGHWVNAETGVAVEGTPVDGKINGVSVVTDYDYAVSKGLVKDSAYMMEYDSITASLGGNGGYTFITQLGNVSIGGGISTAVSVIFYDSWFRPYDKNIRDSRNTPTFTNKLWITSSWDTRDLVYSPTHGFLLKETITYAGGFIGGSKHFIKTTTDFDIYQKLFDIPVTENWNFMTVIGLHSQFSLILPQWANYHVGTGENDYEWKWSNAATRADLLYTDSMFIARGWDSIYDNKALLDIVLDITMPISAGLLSWNTFLSGTAIWPEPEDVLSMSLTDYYFSLGTGLQIDIPSFPISFFLVKRAKFTDSGFDWQHGSYLGSSDLNDDTGIDFVITFDLDYF